MPRDGALTPRDLAGKLDVLRVECETCDRSGRYRVTTLVDPPPGHEGRSPPARRLARSFFQQAEGYPAAPAQCARM
jgi:hypothetical protein